VECPICQKNVKEASINSHIDKGCIDAPPVTKPLGRSSKHFSASSSSAPDNHIKRPDRLPQLNYQFVKDQALKKKLVDMGLSAAGPRQLLERRFTEWVTLWNANCDATHPKSKTELRRELDVWDRTLGRNNVSLPGAQIKDKDFDGKGWSTTHDTDFKALIAKARSKVPAKPPGSVISGDLTASSTPHSITSLNQTPAPHISTEISGSRVGIVGQEVVDGASIETVGMFNEEIVYTEEPQSSPQHPRAVPIYEREGSITSDRTPAHPLRPYPRI
jgi:E3 ubiquitin-protein ligase RAD18